VTHGPVEGKRFVGEGIVRVQWDPERSFRIGRLDYRSIQIGIPAELVNTWINEWIVGIEDVTDKARELKKVVDEDKDRELGLDDVKEKGLFPDERVYEVDEDIRKILQMDEVREAAQEKDEQSAV